MDLALLMAAVYGMGVVSILALTVTGLDIAMKEGGWVTAGYLTALAAILAEIARLSLRA